MEIFTHQWIYFLILLILVVVGIARWKMYHFQKEYQQDVIKNLQETNITETEFVTEADLISLPSPVKRYLIYAGVINKPRVKNVRIVFKGEMREKGKAYFPFRSEQYNFFDEPARLFFMKATIMRMPVLGYHRYMNALATMLIKLFGVFPIVKKTGAIMNKAETVTVFNDMCLLAPATLIDKRIQWFSVNDHTAKAIFTNHDISISAILYFNELGQLVNFISNDRTSLPDLNQYPFSTPASLYANFNGVNVMTYGEAIWDYPDGQFVYGKFNLQEIEYNVSSLR